MTPAVKEMSEESANPGIEGLALTWLNSLRKDSGPDSSN